MRIVRPSLQSSSARNATSAHRYAAASCLLLVLALTTTAANATEDAGSGFNVTEIAPGVFVHGGRQVDIDDPARADIANLGFVVGTTCVAVIDTGGSIAIGRALHGAIRARTQVPICYVINTHVHFDHVLGNAAFRSDGPQFVGHANLAAEIAGNRDFFLQYFKAELGPDAKPEDIIGPDRTVADTLDLDLGGRTLRLVAHGRAHTSSDLTVFDSATQTLFMGDLLFMQRLPVFDGSLKGWVTEMQALATQACARVVPGHGPVSAAWPVAGEAQMRYLGIVLAEVRSAIAEGVSLEQAMRDVGSAERGRWLLFEHNHERNVSRAYRELEWE